jgi:alkaline phosphatase
MIKSLLLLLLICPGLAQERRAKNVILFLGDAGGIPILNAASIYGHGAPQKLFIQKMPYIALSDTSSANGWVTDSAAGMTAIVTGKKSNNGVISQSADSVKGQKDGAPLKTVLEYAEEAGLSTGVISNMSMADATPAACYAHSNDRAKAAEIFGQVMTPRFGDGVDLVIGGGKKAIATAMEAAGVDLQAELKAKGIGWYDDPAEIPAGTGRVVSLMSEPFDPLPVVRQAIERLSRNPKGYFLMVEWDMHTDKIQRGLDNAVMMDRLVQQTAGQVKGDTLIIFTADHSFDLRLRGGKPGEPLSTENSAEKKTPIRMENGHTGEEVLIAAQGPGAARVHGFMANTEIFRIMMAAYGWKELPAAPSAAARR